MYPQCTVISNIDVYRFCTLHVSNEKSYVPCKNFDVIFLAYNIVRNKRHRMCCRQNVGHIYIYITSHCTFKKFLNIGIVTF